MLQNKKLVKNDTPTLLHQIVHCLESAGECLIFFRINFIGILA